ncbi:MAG TPA: DedA family protein [Chromatiales bacterium]|nr:DedA family protein [Chromatiales bacterium]
MRLFGPLYDRVMHWAGHPRAEAYLAALSFAESSFFPVPPDVMLAPMVVRRPQRAFRLATITTVASVLGGLFGYAVGYFALTVVEPWLQASGYWEGYQTARQWFEQWGLWVVFAAGFSPIPYKLFTITAGALTLNVLGFAVVSFVGRGMRFFLVAWLLSWVGPRMEATIRRYIEWLGWATVAVVAAAIGWYQYAR